MIRVYDNFLPNFDDYLNRVNFVRFKDEVSQGKTYTDISQDVSADVLYKQLEKHIGFKTKEVISFIRAYRYRPDQPRQTWIHSDATFSQYIGIFFIKPSINQQDDAFCLWDHKLFGKEQPTDLNLDEIKMLNEHTTNPEYWDIRKRFEFQQNRLVICPANYFHSNATFGTHGTLYDSRLVHVLFFNEDKNV